MWESMGPIADRTRERLGASDIAIIQFRRLMLNALAVFELDGRVIGQGPARLPQAALRSWQGVVEKSVPWRTLGASPEEAALMRGFEESADEREMAGAAR